MGSDAARVFKAAVTGMVLLGVSVPLAGEMVSQTAVVALVHVNAAVPAFVRMNVVELVLKGPPTSPVAVKPAPETISKASGIPAMALIKL